MEIVQLVVSPRVPMIAQPVIDSGPGQGNKDHDLDIPP